MSVRTRIRAKAERDLAEIFVRYEEQEPGVGLEFLRCIDAALAGIRRQPEMHPVYLEEIRRALVRRFPYGIYYVAEENTAVVLSVTHLARGQQAIEEALE